MKRFSCFLLMICIFLSFPLGIHAQSTYSIIGNIIDNSNAPALIQSSSPSGAVAIARNMSTGSTFYYRVSGAVLSNSPPLISHGFFPQENSFISNESLSPNQIITPNENTKITDADELPYSAICYVEITFPNREDPYSATAFMISDNVAMTAGHCLYNENYGGWATEVKVYPGKSGYGFFNNPFGTATATEIVVSTQHYETNSQYVDNYDWGFINLGSDDIGNDSGYLGFRYKTGGMNGMSIKVSGYPNPDENDIQYYQYQDSGTINYVADYVMNHTASTEEGQSGAPVFYWDSSEQEWIVIGINVAYSGADNVCVGFYDTLYSFAWSYK